MTTPTRTSATALLCAGAVLLLAHSSALGGSVGEADKPIAAQMFAAPDFYAGRMVTIYGLVISVEPDGSTFVLQDVSQAPLKVVRNDGHLTLPGDQLLVVGKFIPDPADIRLEAHSVTVTQVTGGGGCC